MSASPRRCSPRRRTLGTRTAARPASAPPGSQLAKTLEEFDFTFQRSIKKQVIEHLAQLDFLHARENVVLLGPPDPVSHCSPCDRHWSNSPVAMPVA